MINSPSHLCAPFLSLSLSLSLHLYYFSTSSVNLCDPAATLSKTPLLKSATKKKRITSPCSNIYHHIIGLDLERKRVVFASIMDRGCQSSGDSTITSVNSTSTTINNRDHYLKHLNKLSHKISKPPIITATSTIKKNPFDQPNQLQPQPSSQQPPNQDLQGQQQPPVYNINKSDFRDLVQKLTGSPAHERFSTPPPIHPPKPQSTRLQRIRPPPLVQVSNRPPPLLNSVIPPPQQKPLTTASNPSATNTFIQRSTTPLSPLPPFPAVHAAAESPVSAYMRYLQNTISAVDSNKQFSGFSPLAPLVSPRWNNQTASKQQFPVPSQQQGIDPSQSAGMVAPQAHEQPQFQLPTSPLPFGCLNSPRSPYPLLSPSSFPLSPTVPVHSPRWRSL